MSAHNSSHGSSKKEKEKARFEAQKQRARQVQQKPDIITPSYPLFGAPKKVDTPDESSQKIQRVLGKYNEVRPFENTGPIIGVSPSTPSTPITADPKHGFFSSGSNQRINGQHKQSDSLGRKPDPNRSFNIPNAHSSSRESTSSNTRTSLPHFPSSSSHPSHDKSKSRSPVKVHPFSHSSPAKPANPRPSVSPVTTQKPKKLSLDSYRAALDAANNKTSSLNTSTLSQDSKSPTDNQQSTHKSMKSSGKGPVTPPNGIVSENARTGVHRPPKLVIPDTQSKNADILDEIFNEMTIQPPLTGIHTPRKTEDKFPFPTTTAPITTIKTSKVDDVPVPNITTAETEVKEDKPTVATSVTKSPPHATVEAKPKPDLAERRGGTTAMKPSNINRVLDRLNHWISRIKKKTSAARCRPRTSPSSSSDSSSSGSESGSDSDSNNSGSDSDSDDDEDEKEEKEKEEKEKDESKEKEEIKKDLDKSVDSTSSTESQPNQPKWSLLQFINKPKTSPLSNTSTGSKPSGGSKIDEENSAMLDDLVTGTSKSLEDIGPSSTLPFDIPLSSDSDDDVTLPGCDADRLQNGENSENEIYHRNSCSPSALSSSDSDSDTCDVSMSKPTGKHPVKRQRQSSSNKPSNDKVKKDGKSLKKSHSSVNNLKSSESKHKEEKKRKLTSTKRKKILSREMIDSDSDIDVDVVSVTPDTKHTAPMSSNLSDHNQNDKLSITKQLFSSPKNSHDSSDSKLNNSQSSSGKPKLGRHKDDVEHKKHLYKKNHKDNVKKIIPDCYKSSDEDESTDCAQDVEEIFESTEDFRPPSLHSPLPSYPFVPCKNVTSPSTDKSLALQELSIKSLPSQKSTKSPISKLDIKNQIVPSKTDESVVVKINLSLIKNLKKEPVKKSEPEPIKKLTKDKKESSVNVDVKPSENSSGKENVKKSKKVSESVDESVSVKKEVTNVIKASPVKVMKKESDSVKQSTIVKSESETVSKKSSKLSESVLSKDEVKKDKDSSSSKKESKESRTKEPKASKRKSESSLSNDSAKKHKSSSSTSITSKTSSSGSSHSTSNLKKSSSNSTENGIDIETEDEKRPPSRSERRNSTSSTSSRHSNKSNQSKKPKLESKSSKESSSDKTKKASTPVHQNGIESNNHHIPFSKYSDNKIPSSPAKTLSSSSSSKPQNKIDEHSVDHYLSKGKELKHKADPLRDKQPLLSFYTYTEAVLAYIQGAYSMEQKKTEPLRVFTLYNETLHLLKWFTSNIKLDSASHEKKLSGLIYRIQSILYLKMYYLKKNEGLKFKKIIESHEQSKVTKAPHAPSPHWNRSTGIPSPMSPTPSPAGSIGSVGSQGSCELSANKPNGTASIAATANSTPMASPGSVSIPQRIHSVTQQYITISGYLVNARELWDKAEIIAKECHSYFDYLNKQASPLVYTPNSSPQLVHYVQKGLQCLKDT